MAKRLPPQDPRVAPATYRETTSSAPPPRPRNNLPRVAFTLPPAPKFNQEVPAPGPEDEFTTNPWLSGLRRDHANRVRLFQLNIEHILDHAPEYKDALAYDEFSQQIIITRAIPGGGNPGDKVTAQHTLAFRRFCEELLEISFPIKLIEDGMFAVACRKRQHLIRDYLVGLQWDGTKRLHRLHDVYFGAVDTPYNSAVMQKFLIAAAARALDPGCKVDTCMVLEGGQGVGKSTSLQVLFFRPDFINDTPIDLRSKDAYIAIQGKWCVEFAELDGLSKVDAARVKAFLSLSNDCYRGVFERNATSHPRSCVFIATCNEAVYLLDTTGARRFWPVEVGQVDLHALARDREQLWAEAVAAYHAGSPWHLSKEEEGLARMEQDLRRQEHQWEAPIAEFIARKTSVTSTEILEAALRIKDFSHTGKEVRVISQILTGVFGWHRAKVVRGVSRVNGFIPPFKPARVIEIDDDVDVD